MLTLIVPAKPDRTEIRREVLRNAITTSDGRTLYADSNGGLSADPDVATDRIVATITYNRRAWQGLADRLV